jgi:hypothetical protein
VYGAEMLYEPIHPAEGLANVPFASVNGASEDLLRATMIEMHLSLVP